MSATEMAIYALCLGLIGGSLIGFGLGMELAKENKQ